MTDIERMAYIDAVHRAIRGSTTGIRKYLTATCTECGARPSAHDDAHVVIDGFVVIGCEGYWLVDPNALGIARPNWTDARGEEPMR
jgi:hypothetical protein